MIQKLKALWAKSGDPNTPVIYEDICDAGEIEPEAATFLIAVGVCAASLVVYVYLGAAAIAGQLQ